MDEEVRFLYGAENASGLHPIAGLRLGREGPFLRFVQGRRLDSGLEARAREAEQLPERPLDPVVDLADESGPEVYRERFPGGKHLLADAHSGIVLVDLNGGYLAVHFL